MNKTIGSQPMIDGTAYHIGLQCPVGSEVELVCGLRTYFPELPLSEARVMFFDGLADRFIQPESRKQRGWDGKPLKEQDGLST